MVRGTNDRDSNKILSKAFTYLSYSFIIFFVNYFILSRFKFKVAEVDDLNMLG